MIFFTQHFAYQWNVIGRHYNDTLMFRNVFSHFGNMCFQDIISVHIRHFTSILEPNFIFRVLSNEIQGSDVQGELASLGELSKADTERN